MPRQQFRESKKLSRGGRGGLAILSSAPSFLEGTWEGFGPPKPCFYYLKSSGSIGFVWWCLMFESKIFGKTLDWNHRCLGGVCASARKILKVNIVGTFGHHLDILDCSWASLHIVERQQCLVKQHLPWKNWVPTKTQWGTWACLKLVWALETIAFTKWKCISESWFLSMCVCVCSVVFRGFQVIQ